MEQAQSIVACRQMVQHLRQGYKAVAYVPTMGALHAGHQSLMRLAQEEGTAVVVSIYVNPTQFGPHEDYSRYPRPLATDLALCQAAGVQGVFLPSSEEMYGAAEKLHLEMPALTGLWEGASRPGHFNGVMRVVAKLLNVVQPDVLVLGQKDYQQVAVLRQMMEELMWPCRLKVGPTQREPDGLALSSRNQYLTPAQRAAAPRLWDALTQIAQMAQPGMPAAHLADAYLAVLKPDEHLAPDYLGIVQGRTLMPVDTLHAADEPTALAAVYCGSTRLLDNIRLLG